MNTKSVIELLWNEMSPRAVDSFQPHPLMFGCDFGKDVGVITIWLAPEYQSDMFHLSFNLLNINWTERFTPQQVTQMRYIDKEVNYIYCVVWKHSDGSCDKLLDEVQELIKGLPNGTDTPVL